MSWRVYNRTYARDVTSSGEIKESKRQRSQTSTTRLSSLTRRGLSEPASSITNSLSLRAYHEMGPIGFGERFSFALERDDARARSCDRFG